MVAGETIIYDVLCWFPELVQSTGLSTDLRNVSQFSCACHVFWWRTNIVDTKLYANL